MSPRFFTVASVILAAVSMLWMASPVCADILLMHDSSEFTNKMEFDSSTAPAGWTFYPAYSIADGKCQIGDGIETPPGGTGTGMGLLYCPAPATGWTYNYSDGFTYEASVKVVIGDTPKGATHIPDFSIGMSTVVASGSRPFSQLSVGADKVMWGINATAVVLKDGLDNTDAFHTFRVAQMPNSQTYSIWRDGVLLATATGAGYDGSDTGANVQIGGVSAGPYGETIMDYYRSTSGVWAPTPEPSSLILVVLALVGLLAMSGGGEGGCAIASRATAIGIRRLPVWRRERR
jgi:hypothetical protein